MKSLVISFGLMFSAVLISIAIGRQVTELRDVFITPSYFFFFMIALILGAIGLGLFNSFWDEKSKQNRG